MPSDSRNESSGNLSTAHTKPAGVMQITNLSSHHARSGRPAIEFARNLGWLSLGLGLASLMMPRMLARSVGTTNSNWWLRVIGTRELISGAGILLRPHQPVWLWSRVAGDVMDLGLLAVAARQRDTSAAGRLGALSAALTGLAVLDLLVAWDNTNRIRHAPPATGLKRSGVTQIKKSMDVNRSPEACYRFWRDVENFPRFMPHVEQVESLDGTHSRWRVRGPLKQTVQWDAELTSDIPGQQLGWRAMSGAELAHTGLVRFSPAPGQRGTRIEVEFSFHPPLGKAGVMLARMTGDEPPQQISEDLRRFKQLIETGEIPTTIGQPAGRRSMTGRMIHKGLPE